MSASVESADHYAVLGVSRSAGKADLKRSYKALARQWHPDKNLDNLEEATAAFAKVGRAYEVLSDPDTRAIFDKLGNRGLERCPLPRVACMSRACQLSPLASCLLHIGSCLLLFASHLTPHQHYDRLKDGDPRVKKGYLPPDEVLR